MPQPWKGLTIPQRFADQAAAHPDLPAIVSDRGATTYRQLHAQSDRVAAWVASRGLGRGDKVGLYCINSEAFAAAYLGIQKAGGTVVPVNLLLNPKEVAYILADAGARGLVYFEGFGPAVEAFRGEVPGLDHVACIGDSPARPDDVRWADVLATGGEPPAPALDPEEDLAALIYTSGTTGRPKGAMLTHRNLVANTFSVAEALGGQPGEDRFLTVLPMFHAFAATAGMLYPLLHGMSFVPVPKFDPEGVARAIRKHQATIFLGVPSMYAVMLRLEGEAAEGIRGLRYAVSGGAAMPVEIMRQFEAKFGVRIYEGDGPTECSPVTCVNPIGGERRPGTVGLAVPGVEMRVLDGEGREPPVGEIGEICVRGPNVMAGYWNQPEETAASFFGEWFRTGDLGTVDEDGYFSIVDRIKDMIIVNGMNVYPRMVEEVLYQHPAVREAAVVGEPHPTHGEIPVAFISLREGQEADSAAIRSFCLDHLGRHEVPRKVRIIPDLPKNAAGKIVKRELRKQGEVERGIA